MSRNTIAYGPIVLAAALLALSPAVADDGRGGEVGFMVGVVGADEALTRDSGTTTDPALGMRGGAVFNENWGWFVDALHTIAGTQGALGDARTVVARTGFDYLFTPELDTRWFVSASAGWMVTDYENGSVEDFHNPIASVSFGQRMRLGTDVRLRWQVRLDRTLDDARLTDDLTQGYALVGFSWGPGTMTGIPKERRGELRGVEPLDADEDGVRNRRDRCPGTPAGVSVNDDGCPLDADGDSVPDGIDTCPRTRQGDPVDERGCPLDADGDGVSDLSDFCANTPQKARVDEWGCPRDLDGDGVPAGLDECPGTLPGAIVDDRGCTADGDGDGVVDGVDRCPATPEGSTVDDRGCTTERDTDEDGVLDDKDRCPATPKGVSVDATGCTVVSDADADGVPDDRDRCPATPKGVSVDAMGCTVVSDADADGVPDSRDRCPATPKGVSVDTQGCAPDSDADGVRDAIDACPGTSPRAGAVDERGCPVAASLFSNRRTIVLEGVHFEVNGTRLTPDSMAVLDDVARSLLEEEGVRVEIGGHTDSTGDAGSNAQLSTRRAEAVWDQLLTRGIDPSRLELRGYGETRPIAGNETEAGRARNRRVELKRID